MERQPTKLLYVLPPFSSFVVMCMNCLAGLIEAHLIVCQQMNAQDFSDRRVQQQSVAMFILVLLQVKATWEEN